MLYFSRNVNVERSTSTAALFYRLVSKSTAVNLKGCTFLQLHNTNCMVNVDRYKSAAIDTVDAADVQKSVAFYHAPNNDEKETSKLVLS